MIYFSSIILNRVECNCFVYAAMLVDMLEKYDFCLLSRLFIFRVSAESEVHKLFFTPAAYLPLLHRLSLSKLLSHADTHSIILTFKKMAQHIRTNKGCAWNRSRLWRFINKFFHIPKGVDGLLMALYDFIINWLLDFLDIPTRNCRGRDLLRYSFATAVALFMH